MVMTEGGAFRQFAGHRYINVETFRKNGEGVKTPVWFAETGLDTAAPLLYLYTIGNSGKAKRIRNNSSVKIAPCTARGKVLGDWVPARAEILQGEAAAEGMRALNRKYFPWKQLLDAFASLRKRERIVVAIRPATAG
jgi:PPOX class probable F420-dependent enzyme